jgi:hypothetical protein
MAEMLNARYRSAMMINAVSICIPLPFGKRIGPGLARSWVRSAGGAGAGT